MTIVKLSFLSPLALSVIFSADAFVVPALYLPARALSPISRLYSDNAENTPASDEKSDSKENDILNSPAFLKRKLEVIQSDISKVEAQIMNANTAIEEGKEIWGDKFAQLSQERKILQERMSKQSEELSDSATVEVVQKLLSVLDNYERAFGVIVPETDEQRAVEEDYKKSYQSIIDTFSELGVQKIKTVGEEFDYALHNAVMTRPDDADDGVILDELQSGFIMGENQLIRPAMVIVAC